MFMCRQLRHCVSQTVVAGQRDFHAEGVRLKLRI